MRMQADRDVVFDVLEKQFLKPHQDGGESQGAVVTWSTHSTDFLCAGTMKAVLRHNRMVFCEREM